MIYMLANTTSIRLNLRMDIVISNN